MKYSTILVQLDLDTPSASRLHFAWDLARRFQAHLVGFCAGEPHILVAGDLSTGGTAVLQSQIDEIEDLLQKRREEFDRIAGDSDRSSWRSEVGEPARFLALHSRAADLVILGAAQEWSTPNRTVNHGEFILSSGRPVLIANKECRPVRAENVLIAWKDSREARRAVVDAMPFLIAAKQVHVATIDEGDQANARESAADVASFLSRHGIKAQFQVIDAGVYKASEALMRAKAEIGADMVVSGAYGHSRLREWMFGGVTKELLAIESANLLMSN